MIQDTEASAFKRQRIDELMQPPAMTSELEAWMTRKIEQVTQQLFERLQQKMMENIETMLVRLLEDRLPVGNATKILTPRPPSASTNLMPLTRTYAQAAAPKNRRAHEEAAKKGQLSGTKRKTGAVIGRRDEYVVIPVDDSKLNDEAMEEIPAGKFVDDEMQPPKTVNIGAVWVGRAVPREKMSAAAWREELAKQGAPAQSILQVEYMLQDHVEILYRTENQDQVLQAIRRVNPHLKKPSHYEPVRSWVPALPDQSLLATVRACRRTAERARHAAARRYYAQVADDGVALLRQRRSDLVREAEQR